MALPDLPLDVSAFHQDVPPMTATDTRTPEDDMVDAARRYADWARHGRPWLAVSVMLLADPSGLIPPRVVVVEPESACPDRRA